MVWLALVVGNSRFHWGIFEANRFLQRWDTAHCSPSQLEELHQQKFASLAWTRAGIQSPPAWSPTGQDWPEVWAASVVETTLEGLASYPALTVIKRHQLPLQDLYETVGVDRALTLLGAGTVYGWPVLVVDGGTALTFTAGEEAIRGGPGRLIGGAILPGLGLQFRALHDHTDQLPWLDHRQLPWPDRWARTTEGAIASGVFHTHLAGVQDFLANWWQLYPGGKVLFTGGDGEWITDLLRQHQPPLPHPIHHDANLMFWGVRAYRQAQTKDR